MKKTWYLIGAIVIIVVLALVLVNQGSEKVAEESVEKAIEQATNGTADVDFDDGTLTVNTNAGTFSASGGEDLELPDNFPSDIYIPDGNIVTATEMSEMNSFSVSIESDDSISQLKNDFETQLASEGWTITLTLALEDSTSVGAEKDNRSVSIFLYTDEDSGKTLVGISTSANTEE